MSRLLVVIALALLSVAAAVAGCSSVEADQVSIYRMLSFSSAEEESLVTITEPPVVDVFQKAINNAKKEPGVVNMADPQFKLDIGDRAYFLWINETSGTIMNVEDTHTIYTLSDRSAEQIYQVIIEHFGPEI